MQRFLHPKHLASFSIAAGVVLYSMSPIDYAFAVIFVVAGLMLIALITHYERAGQDEIAEVRKEIADLRSKINSLSMGKSFGGRG